MTRAAVLHGGAASFHQSDSGIELSVPGPARNDMDTIVVLQLDAPVDALQPIK